MKLSDTRKIRIKHVLYEDGMPVPLVEMSKVAFFWLVAQYIKDNITAFKRKWL